MHRKDKHITFINDMNDVKEIIQGDDLIIRLSDQWLITNVEIIRDTFQNPQHNTNYWMDDIEELRLVVKRKRKKNERRT